MLYRSWWRVLLLTGVIVHLAGCTASLVDSITVTPATQSLVTGQTAQLSAAGSYGHGSSHPSSSANVTDLVTWASSAPSVADVNSTGEVTALNAGTTTITASMPGFSGTVSGSATITVTASASAAILNTNEPIVAVSISPGSQTVATPGQTGQFIALGTSGLNGLQTNVTSQVTWTSSNVSVATINAAGLATGVGQGSTTITAIATNPDKTVVTATATFTVTNATGTTTTAAEPVASLSIVPGSQSVATPGLTGQFIAIGTAGGTGLQSNLTSQVTWSSSDVAVGTINAAGLATGVSQGTSAITAIAKNPDGSIVTATVTFTVTNAVGTTALEPVASLSIVPGSQAVSTPGLTGQFIAVGTAGGTGLQSNMTSQVTWSSSDVAVATINATGLALGVGQGTTAITAIAKNPDGSIVTATVTFTVTNAVGTGAAEPIATLSILPSAQSVASPNQTSQFIAIGAAGGTGLQSVMTNKVVWSSSSVQVATISAGGLATGVSQGTTAITAIATNPDGSVVTATATFTVMASAPEPISALTITPASVSVALPFQTGQFIALGSTGTPAVQQNLTNQVAWSSSNSAVALIGSSGIATALTAGTTTITAIATNPDGSVVSANATFTVTGVLAEPLQSVTIIPNSQSVASPGQSSNFIAIGTYTGPPVSTQNLTQQVAWNSSDTAVATIDANGVATAVGQGTTAITVIATNPDGGIVTGSATFTVVAGTTEQITALNIYPNSQGATAQAQQSQFFVLGTQGGTSLQYDVTSQVVWASSNAAVASVGSANVSGTTPGLATAVGQGATTITATYTNVDGSKVVASASYSVSIGPAQEPLLSITIVPNNISVGQILDTGQFLAFGTFSTTPTIQDLTNQVTWISSSPEVFPINTSGVAGAPAGIATAYGEGAAVIIAEAKNPDGTIVTGIATMTCPIGECSPTPVSGQLATLTVYNTGQNSTTWLVTAPSNTGEPNLIHCGPGSTSGGSVCVGNYPVGSTVTLTASPTGSSFGGWSANCETTVDVPDTSPTCTVSLTSNETVGAIFN